MWPWWRDYPVVTAVVVVILFVLLLWWNRWHLLGGVLFHGNP